MAVDSRGRERRAVTNPIISTAEAHRFRQLWIGKPTPEVAASYGQIPYRSRENSPDTDRDCKPEARRLSYQCSSVVNSQRAPNIPDPGCGLRLLGRGWRLCW
jgi:hypothetical protein